jgi:hypothetical protein
VFEKRGLRRIFGCNREEEKDAGENCIVRSFIIFFSLAG